MKFSLVFTGLIGLSLMTSDCTSKTSYDTPASDTRSVMEDNSSQQPGSIPSSLPRSGENTVMESSSGAVGSAENSDRSRYQGNQAGEARPSESRRGTAENTSNASTQSVQKPEKAPVTR